jgi:hypothetical protein
MRAEFDEDNSTKGNYETPGEYFDHVKKLVYTRVRIAPMEMIFTMTLSVGGISWLVSAVGLGSTAAALLAWSVDEEDAVEAFKSVPDGWPD